MLRSDGENRRLRRVRQVVNEVLRGRFDGNPDSLADGQPVLREEPPHFARIMVRKGYVATTREAFVRYLDESAPGYVDRDEPSLEDGISRITKGGGISSLAHPVRLGKRDAAEEERLIGGMCDAGLHAIEVYHSDHPPEVIRELKQYATRHDLLVTGGSDFHGDDSRDRPLGRIALPAVEFERLCGARPRA